ncbi:pantoate--beta-alanine ligase [uncultured Helicobacter sp.]|uniref:pantoate--beta-alanine ligase n=1 Tax=uncultured Helicobacter sp. TaxID=175537 RepID=UPI0026F1104C|nr:pantoate--beta-alanine ligase [uncultured Helicobacter sp.]
MKVIHHIADLQSHRKDLPYMQSIGLVPTMGALHQGHLSLIESSLKGNDCTIVSIFVNPTQFGVNEDFSAYPRTLDQDIALCERAGVDVVFAPSAQEMYGSDEISFNPPVKMGYVLEGFDRPTHFAGVIQIVLKLFCLVMPHRAYFGCKDAQQVLIIQKMTKDLFLPIEIVPCPIQRDSDGLALSSRNVYLSTKEREAALCIPRTIMHLQAEIERGQMCVEYLQPLVAEGLQDVDKVFYAGFFSHTLEPLAHIIKGNSIFLVAARVGQTRLLDNLWI